MNRRVKGTSGKDGQEAANGEKNAKKSVKKFWEPERIWKEELLTVSDALEKWKQIKTQKSWVDWANE